MRIPALFRSRVVVALFVIVAVFSSVAAAQTIYFQPFRLLVYSMLDTGPGTASNYGVALIDDKQTPGLCLAVVTDTTTGQFTATSVPAEACESRRFE